MSDALQPPLNASDAVIQSQQLFAHAWMVRTFVKHSPEVEDFPELMAIARNVFDVARSLESRVDDPAAYFRQLKKKLTRLKAAAAQFREDAPRASTHTNFQQAVLSMDACIAGWEQLLKQVVLGPTASLATAAESPDDEQEDE